VIHAAIRSLHAAVEDTSFRLCHASVKIGKDCRSFLLETLPFREKLARIAIPGCASKCRWGSLELPELAAVPKYSPWATAWPTPLLVREL